MIRDPRRKEKTMNVRRNTAMSIREQAAQRGFAVLGKLARYPEGDLSRYHYCFVDEAGNLYVIHLGVLTILAVDGKVY